MNKLLLISLLVTFAGISEGVAQCDTLIPADVFFIDGTPQQFQPGSTVCLQGGSKDYLYLKNIHGTADNPITFINSGGAIIIETDHYYGIKIADCSFIRLSGSGDGEITYGIQVLRVDNGTGISVTELSTDVEIDYVEIANTSIAGVYAKSEPDCLFNSTRDKFTMNNFWLHDCYLHDIADEGLYIGSSKYTGQTINCNGKDTTVFPHVIIGARIYNNIVENTGWDGIQVSSAQSNCQVFGNTIRNDSYEEYQYQMSGILIGGGSSCDCFNNQIFDGKGDGIDILGLGNMKVYNNLIVNAGRTFKPNDPLAFKHGIYVGQTVTTPNATFDFFNNTIVSPKSNGIKYSNDEAIRASFINNLITNPGRLLVEGDQAYINGTQPAIQKSTNFFTPENGSARFLGQSPNPYDLLPNSPAVNTGTNLSGVGVAFDIINRDRPFHTYFDIGAFECYDPYADIDELPNDELISVYPNPAHDYIILSNSVPGTESISCSVLNTAGQVVENMARIEILNHDDTILNIQHLPGGIYILEVTTRNRIFYQKFTVL